MKDEFAENRIENQNHLFGFTGLSTPPPQFAIWIEDTEGNYLSTLFVTNRIATEGWRANSGNRRK